MENYDLLASLNVKASTAPSSDRGIVIASGPRPGGGESKSSISALVAVRQPPGGGRRAHRQASRNQLIGILTESSASRRAASSGTRRRAVCVEPKLHRAGIVAGSVVQVQLQGSGDAGSSVREKSGVAEGASSSSGKQKIPRPANAFMLFANEWRKKLAVENPRESNKDISVRLGVLWKNMDKDIKEKYFALAREVDAEHKRKYPGEI
ncbi:transcription factor SOX-3-like [Venturia canescens]|uniref:transcription factor SOX-3-like n=1 Tax=Venturia canescens TaxID=32260 RepID=UPI001C9CCD5F|nr:transcription factor SOX-3-like [Venturia canescens]